MIYKLELTALGKNKYNYNEKFLEFIISASSEIEAREIAANKDLLGSEFWINNLFSSCKELDLNNKIISYLFIKN
jgi:hypothetical protein